MSEKLTRIAIINSEKCKPTRCRQECKRACPVVLQGIYNLDQSKKNHIFHLY